MTLGTFLGLLFITLKLTGVIAWSWWWVLLPIWLPLSIILILLAIIASLGTKQHN
jgi:hypothetical protein